MDENSSAHFNYCHIVPITEKSHGTYPAHAPAKRGSSCGLQKPWLPRRGGLLPLQCHVQGKETARKTFGGAWVPRQTTAATLVTWRTRTTARTTHRQQRRPASAQLLTSRETQISPVPTKLWSHHCSAALFCLNGDPPAPWELPALAQGCPQRGAGRAPGRYRAAVLMVWSTAPRVRRHTCTISGSICTKSQH